MSHSCQCDTTWCWHKILGSARADGSTTRWPSVHNKMAAVLSSGWLQINWWKLYYLYDNHLHFFDNIRVVIVEVRLFGVKLVQVELLSVLVPWPGGAPKHALLSDIQGFFKICVNKCLPWDVTFGQRPSWVWCSFLHSSSLSGSASSEIYVPTFRNTLSVPSS